MQHKQPDRAQPGPHAEILHVLMVGPGPRVRGGINSVITAYLQSSLWQGYSFKWLSTYDDRGAARKIIAALRAYMLAPALIGRADIVHVHGGFRTSFLRKLPLLLMAKAMRKRVIFHYHGGSFERASNVRVGPVMRWMLASADRVIALSPSCAAGIHSQVPSAEITSLPNPVILPARESARLVEKTEPRILFIGRIEPQKGFSDLLRAMPAVLSVVPTAKFVVAGDGDVEGARQLASELNVTGAVTFLGFVRGERKEQELRRAAVFCLPSYDEGMPMALLEAMSYGVPVIATPVGGIPDVVRSGENGLLVTPGDVDGLSSAILSLLTNQALSAGIGSAGFVHIERFHSTDHICTLLHGIYTSLVSKPTPEGGHAMDGSRS